MSALPRQERRLVSIRRFVPAPLRGVYDDAWNRLHAAATARGGHAWRFHSADEEGVYLEFLEFGMESDLRQDVDVRAAIQALHVSFGDPYPPPQTLEEWVEVPATPGTAP